MIGLIYISSLKWGIIAMVDNTMVMQNAQVVPVISGSYMSKINAVPMLSAEEELELANRFQEQNDLKAAQQLIMSHLRLVVKIAKKYAGYGLNNDDLVQEGAIGLMKAVKRYQPSRLVRLATFAVHWIKAEIQDYIIKNWRLVKVATTKAQKKLFYNLRKLRKSTSWMSHEERKIIARELDVPVKEVEVMEQRLTAQDVNIFQPVEDDDKDRAASNKVESNVIEGESITVEDEVIAADSNSKVTNMLRKSFSKLDDRLKKIIEKRYLSESKATLDELASDLAISKERVRQLENKAIKLLKADCAHLVA